MKKFFFILVSFLILGILFSKKLYHYTDGTRTVVAVQPLNTVDKKMLDSVISAIHSVYTFDVVLLPEIEIPADAFIQVKSPRYRAEKLIAYLWKHKPDSVDYIIGITNKDISTTKRDAFGKTKEPASRYQDWGIMGLGYCPGKSCVVSTYRLKTSDKKLFVERIKKVVVHELGHNLWLPHCPEKGCVMNDANETIKSIDKEKLALCDKCRKKIE